ncbi:hypothetical protein I6B70_13120 [Staphylococcus aureus]|nr:hypothetical protein [Staphylococcus aureus]HDT6947481.1 hypothetical protein [Staphylococcus aureus]
MYNNYLSKKILKKVPKPANIVNVYSNNLFAEFYHNTTDENGFHNDLDFFKKHLRKNKLTVEFASGTGRITTPLLRDGYKILGIEYEKSMIDIMPEDTKKNVINASVFDINKNEELYKIAESFIIPATSISLFSINQIEELFSYLKDINERFSIIFDIVNIESLITNNPQKVINENGTFYYINFPKDEYIIYNLYHKNSNMLGYSVKYNHTKESLLSLLFRLGYTTTIYDIDNYSMIKAEYKNG